MVSAMESQKDASGFSHILKLSLNEDRFFMEAHVKLRPVDFSARGSLAGFAYSPKNMDENALSYLALYLIPR